MKSKGHLFLTTRVLGDMDSVARTILDHEARVCGLCEIMFVDCAR